MPFTPEEIVDLFTYHAPKGDQQERYQNIREAAKIFAWAICNNTQPSADQTHSIRLLRSAVQFANASIALEKD